jgi:xylulokinase
MSLMGVDVGSSGCKATVFAADGRELAQATAPYSPRFTPPDRVELDPEVLWQATAAAIGRAAAGAPADPVTALTIGTHGETIIPLDAQGRPLSAAILNADSRARDEVPQWEEGVGRETIFSITGLVLSPMYPLLKIGWLKKHQADLFSKTSRFSGVIDYLLTRLGLPPYVDHSLASRYLALDVRTRTWSERLLARAGLSPEMLPQPVPAGTTAGALSDEAAAAVGLRPGVPVVVGGHDQACGALGAGAIAPGMVSDSLGTYECLVVVVAEPTLSAEGLAAGIDSYCYVLPDRFMSIAYFPSGVMVKWFRDTFGEADAAAAQGQDLYAYLESVAPAEPTGLLVLPHLIGSCTPHYDSAARGAIYGLTPSTTRHQLYRAVLEGIACEFSIVVDLLRQVVGRFDSLVATGGGARSTLGLQLRAAMTGLRIETPEVREAACLGAAILGGVATGLYRDVAEAVAQTVRPGAVMDPDPTLAAAYTEQRARYREMYPALGRLR